MGGKQNKVIDGRRQQIFLMTYPSGLSMFIFFQLVSFPQVFHIYKKKAISGKVSNMTGF